MVFDKRSGIRERLALLAVCGPSVCPDWAYYPHSDVWIRYGRRIPVSQEATASLDLIQRQHGMDRQSAMTFIGYPERVCKRRKAAHCDTTFHR